MKLYTIEKAEVKTVYNIEINRDAVLSIVAEACKNKLSEFLWKTERLDLSAVALMDAEQIEKAFFSMWDFRNTREDNETIGFVVREILGFDGIENYGRYVDGDETIEMVVYKHGDKMN